MLPPIDEQILQSNPKFALLHSALAKNILNPSGSSKNHPAQRERDAVTEALKTARTRSAKSQLLKSALRTVDLSPQSSSNSSSSTTSKLKPPPPTKFTPLPSELIELILLLSSHLSSPPLAAPHQKLLDSTTQWAALATYLPQVAALVSSHLHTQALALARIHSPSTNASYLHRAVPKLAPGIQALMRGVEEQQGEVGERRLGLVGKTNMLLGLHHLGTTLCILLLEQTKHGLLSRHLKARAETLSLTAQQLSCEAREKRVKGERAVYTEEVKSALFEYMRTLRDGRERLRERKGQAEKVLWGYGVGRGDGEGGNGKEKVMREIARAYKELQRDISEVSRDVGRLKGR